jgi:hypothetical protein
VRMRNPSSVVWMNRMGNMAFVVQVLHRRRFLSDWKTVLSAGLGPPFVFQLTLRVVRSAQVNGDGNFQSGPLFFVVVVVKDARTVSQWFWRAINCFSSYWLVSAVLSWSLVVWLTRSTFETGINRLVLYLDFRVVIVNRAKTIVLFIFGVMERQGCMYKSYLTSVLLRTEI